MTELVDFCADVGIIYTFRKYMKTFEEKLTKISQRQLQVAWMIKNKLIMYMGKQMSTSHRRVMKHTQLSVQCDGNVYEQMSTT